MGEETTISEAISWQAAMPAGWASCLKARVGEEGPLEEPGLRKPRWLPVGCAVVTEEEKYEAESPGKVGR
jgi:hypothetical protein